MLEYEAPKPSRDPGRFVVWAIFALALYQLVWIVPYDLEFAVWKLHDGQPKQPLRDFVISMGSAFPSILNLFAGFLQCQIQWKRGELHVKHRAAFAGIIFSLLFVVPCLISWVWDDLVNRSVPHPVMELPG